MLRKTSCFYPLLIMVLLLPASAAAGMEITGDLRLENIGFSDSRTSTDTTFPGADFFWNGSLVVTQDISDTFAFEAGYYRDLILRNVVYSQVQYTTDYFSLGIGTLLGIFNSAATPVKTGISTTMRLELPGAVFVSVRSEASMGGDIGAEGDYSMERNDITLGFMVLNALCSFGLDSKRFAIVTAGLETIDSLTDYSLRIVAFEKNVPFRLHFLFSYQNLRKTFRDGVTNPSAGVDSLILGMGLDLDLSADVSFHAGASGSLYSVGTGLLTDLSVIGFETPLFSADAGVTVKLSGTPPVGAPLP